MNPPISPDLLPFAKGNTAICYDPALIALCTSQLSSNLSIHWWRSFLSSVAHFFCPYLFYSHSSSEYCLFYYNIWRHMPPWSIPIILNLLIMEQPKHSQLSGYYLNTLWLITHLYWPSLCSEDTVFSYLINSPFSSLISFHDTHFVSFTLASMFSRHSMFLLALQCEHSDACCLTWYYAFPVMVDNIYF